MTWIMKRFSLRLFVASIAISAIMGIWALLAGDLDVLQVRVLVTSLCTTAASMLIGACAVSWEQQRGDVAPPLGIASSVTGWGMLVAAIWVDIDAIWYYELALSAIILGVSLAHISLLAMARLPARTRWVTGLGMLASLSLAGVCIALIFWDYPPEWIWRVIGVLTIVISASSIAVPVLDLLGRYDDGASR